jgi:hypothetical protein
MQCSSEPKVIVVNPDEKVTSVSFLAWLDARQSGQPVTTSVSAAETLAEIRQAGEE